MASPSRRSMIRLVGGSMTATFIGISGCVSNVLDPNKEAREELKEAGVHLQTADNQFNDETERAFNAELGNYDFDGDRIRDSLDEAVTHINRARTEASGDYVDNVEAFETVHDAFRDVTGGMEATARIGNALEQASDDLDFERYQDALDTVQSAREEAASVVETLEDVRDRIDGIDPENFSVDPDASQPYFDLEETVENIDEAVSVTDALRVLSDSLIPLVQGTEHVTAGNEALENDNYGGASQEYREAESLFREASRIAGEIDTTTLPEDASADIEEYICLMDQLEEATGLLADAATAFEQGNNSRGRSRAEEAGAILESDRCSRQSRSQSIAAPPQIA